MTLWHGGPTVRGDLLLPPEATGRCRSDPDDVTDGWVYVTPTRHLAAMYAGSCRGWLYEVVAVGEVEQDPGSVLPPGESLRCRAARIVRRFRLSAEECERIEAVVAHLDRLL